MSEPKVVSLAQGTEPGPLDIAQITQGLGANRLATTIHYFPEIASTNSYAKERAESGAGEGELVVAESQSHGRGRLGRRWESPPFANLYVSIVLRPKLAPAHVAQITLMAAVALAEVVEGFVPQKPAIKWPNDILIGGKKLAGILSEAACSAERVEYVILGIGVNLNYACSAMPEELRRRATSVLEAAGRPVQRESFLQRLIQGIERCYGELEQAGFDAMAARWESYFAWRGRRVRVELLDQVTTGTATGIDRDGALVIVDDRGAPQRILAGDVILAEN
ncbi:MAG TPA: biotin--[acetyl-CoA-carboxylase] ligase [Candidatus Limnocylindria bacterium]|nr:biotin--[acetyl-CoA-carboxylase] ligase [Candidatus Limnocylindria bacterium]